MMWLIFYLVIKSLKVLYLNIILHFRRLSIAIKYSVKNKVKYNYIIIYGNESNMHKDILHKKSILLKDTIAQRIIFAQE